jgi:hypothetical protein
MCLNSILLDNTPLYADILSVINDYSVGDKSYWKGQFNECIKEINKHSGLVFRLKYNKPYLNLLRREWKLLQQKLNLNTKKKLVDFYLKNGIIEPSEEKSIMRMIKKRIQKVYPTEVYEKKLIVYSPNQELISMYSKYEHYYSNEPSYRFGFIQYMR